MNPAPSAHFPLAEAAAEAWLRVQTNLNYTPSAFIPRLIEACHADIALITAHRHDMTDLVAIERATNTINGIYQRIERFKAMHHPNNAALAA